MLLITIAKLLLALAPQAQGTLVWTGDMNGNVDAVKPKEKDAAQLAPELRKELASLVTRTDLARDYAGKLEKLDQLRAWANWSYDYPGKAEFVAEIAETRAEWLEKLGRHEEAVFAAWHPLVTDGEQNKAPYHAFVWAPADPGHPRVARVASEIDGLARTVALRKRFPVNAPATQGGDAIESVVWDAIEQGQTQTLKDFGTRCVAAMQKVMLQRKDDEPRYASSTLDPMTILFELDRRAAQAFYLSTLGKRGPIWTVRVIRAMAGNGATRSPWIASGDPNVPSRFDDAQTLQVIDALAAQPMSSSQYFQLLDPLVGRDTVTPAVQAYLLGQVQATDAVLLTLLRSMLDGVRVGPNKRALYEAFLDSPDPELRGRCAGALRYYPVGPATFRATLHGDPGVRSLALQGLVRHSYQPYNYTSNGVPANTPRRWIEVPRTPEIQATLLKLARDPESSVRVALTRALQSAQEDPPADVLELLLADTSADVRQAAAFDWSFKPELQARVLERLAGDTDAQVLRAVGYALNMRASINRSGLPLSELELYLPALAAWLANPATNVAFDPNVGPRGPIQGALLSPKGARMIFDVCIRGPHKDVLAPVLLDSVDWERDRQTGVWMLESLDAPRIAELFTAACTLWKNQGMIERAENLLYGFVARGELDPAPFLALARDEALARSIRLRALHIAVPKADEALEQCLFDLLASATPAELDADSQACRDFVNQLDTLFKFWTDLEATCVRASSNAKLPDALALHVAGYPYRGGGLDAAATRACVQRWARLDAGWRRWNRGLFYFLDPRVDPGVLELWRSHYRDPQVSESVVYAMGKYSVDESIPLLTESVSADWMSGTGNGSVVRDEAVRVLTMRLDDLGADALLKAIASARNDDMRKKCFDGLEQIRKYQDEKQSWQRRKGGESAREQAITDLLPMLGDKDASIRAAAARSLATLQAAEHLPKLVALLKDKDANVREAAQKALDALNSAGAKKP